MGPRAYLAVVWLAFGLELIILVIRLVAIQQFLEHTWLESQ